MLPLNKSLRFFQNFCIMWSGESSAEAGNGNGTAGASGGMADHSAGGGGGRRSGSSRKLSKDRYLKRLDLINISTIQSMEEEIVSLFNKRKESRFLDLLGPHTLMFLMKFCDNFSTSPSSSRDERIRHLQRPKISSDPNSIAVVEQRRKSHKKQKLTGQVAQESNTSKNMSAASSTTLKHQKDVGIRPRPRPRSDKIKTNSAEVKGSMKFLVLRGPKSFKLGKIRAERRGDVNEDMSNLPSTPIAISSQNNSYEMNSSLVPKSSGRENPKVNKQKRDSGSESEVKGIIKKLSRPAHLIELVDLTFSNSDNEVQADDDNDEIKIIHVFKAEDKSSEEVENVITLENEVEVEVEDDSPRSPEQEPPLSPTSSTQSTSNISDAELLLDLNYENISAIQIQCQISDIEKEANQVKNKVVDFKPESIEPAFLLDELDELNTEITNLLQKFDELEPTNFEYLQKQKLNLHQLIWSCFTEFEELKKKIIIETPSQMNPATATE